MYSKTQNKGQFQTAAKGERLYIQSYEIDLSNYHNFLFLV